MKNPRDRNWPDDAIAKPAPAPETPPAGAPAPKDDKAKPKPGLVSEAPYSPMLIDPNFHWE